MYYNRLFDQNSCYKNLLDAYEWGAYDAMNTICGLITLCIALFLLLRVIGYLAAPFLLDALMNNVEPR